MGRQWLRSEATELCGRSLSSAVAPGLLQWRLLQWRRRSGLPVGVYVRTCVLSTAHPLGPPPGREGRKGKDRALATHLVRARRRGRRGATNQGRTGTWTLQRWRRDAGTLTHSRAALRLSPISLRPQ